MRQAVKVGGKRDLGATSAARVVCHFASGVLTRVSLDAPAEVGPSSKPKPGFWKLLDWKLMFALLFPVTLETLDYTGMSVAPVE